MPHRWPLLAQPANRNEDPRLDARLVNGFAEYEPETGETWIKKRIGYSVVIANIIPFGSGRGMYTWITPSTQPNGQVANYAVISNGANASLVLNGNVTGTPLGLPDTPSNWSFTETQGATRYLVFASSLNMYYTTGSGWTLITLPSSRGRFITGLAYLDGSIYFMDELGQIFGSAIEDPTTWTNLNMIPAKKVPGIGIWFGRQLSYVIALKTQSMEVFYDGNGAPPGSALLQIDGATRMYGCADHDTAQEIDGTIIYLSNNNGNSPQIVRVDNLVPTVISTPPIERLFRKSLNLGGVFHSFAFKFGGHRFYGITHEATNITMVYDLDQNKPTGYWYQWTDTDGSFFKMQSTGINHDYTNVFLSATTGTLYAFGSDEQLPTDAGVTIPVTIVTGSEDFGTRRRKTLHRMYIRADQKSGGTLYVSRSDNDYQQFSTPKALDLTQNTPYIEAEGTFVKRAYKLVHFAPTPFRIRSGDLQMDIGTI